MYNLFIIIVYHRADWRMLRIIENSKLLAEYDENIRIYKAFEAEIEHLVRSILQASQINYNAITSRL